METNMKRLVVTGIILALAPVVVFLTGCDKEKIVTSTEYVHDTKYIELPGDTVFRIDTLYHSDSVLVHDVDTIRIHDTIRTTIYVHDTVVTVHNHYDTITVTRTDTVFQNQYSAGADLAVAALQNQTTPMVFDFIAQEFSLSGGWVMYLASEQMDIAHPSANIYDIYGYLEYWTTDWASYYPMEFYWRLTYTGGDPADLNNWEMSEPPTPVANHQPGISPFQKTQPIQLMQK
jgi:hypothetical protein